MVKNTLKSRRVRALLAGGLVLGVGIGVTLAVWNDEIFQKGTFDAGGFMLEGSINEGGAWAEYGTPDEAAVIFNLDNLQQQTDYYSEFWVRIKQGDKVVNPVELTLPTVTAGTGGNEDYLNYEIYNVTSTGTCSAGNLGTAPKVWNGNIGAESITATPPLPDLTGKGDVSASDPVKLCFVVKSTTELKPVLTASATWKLLGTETSP